MAWTAGIWPAYEHPRETHAQMVDCINATTERKKVLGYGSIIGLDGYIATANEHREFGRAMNAIKANIPLGTGQSKYLDTSLADGSDSYNTWFHDDYTPGVALMPELTLDRACEILRLPTNVLTVYSGPYRLFELSGLGGYNTDANVGHSHGSTNALTAAGGSYFPPGRDTWYTTDYGWDAIKSLLDLCLWTTDHNYGTMSNHVWDGSDHHTGFGTTWALAKTSAEASSGAGNIQGPYTRGVRFNATDFWAAYFKHKYKISISGLDDTIGKKVDFYQWASKANSIWQFDAFGQGVLEDQYARIVNDFDLGTAASGTTPNYIGLYDTMPTWCDEPVNNNENRGRGYYLGNIPGVEQSIKSVVKWDFTYV